MSDDFFALPAFKPDTALLKLKRDLRDLRQLTERGEDFLLKGQEVLSLSIEGEALHARLAKRPGRSPEWELRSCRDAAQVRSLLDETKRRLARWTDDS